MLNTISVFQTWRIKDNNATKLKKKNNIFTFSYDTNKD